MADNQAEQFIPAWGSDPGTDSITRFAILEGPKAIAAYEENDLDAVLALVANWSIKAAAVAQTEDELIRLIQRNTQMLKRSMQPLYDRLSELQVRYETLNPPRFAMLSCQHCSGSGKLPPLPERECSYCTKGTVLQKI